MSYCIDRRVLLLVVMCFSTCAEGVSLRFRSVFYFNATCGGGKIRVIGGGAGGGTCNRRILQPADVVLLCCLFFQMSEACVRCCCTVVVRFVCVTVE